MSRWLSSSLFPAAKNDLTKIKAHSDENPVNRLRLQPGPSYCHVRTWWVKTRCLSFYFALVPSRPPPFPAAEIQSPSWSIALPTQNVWFGDGSFLAEKDFGEGWWSVFVCSLVTVACWWERRTRDRKVASSNPGRSGRRIFFSRVNFVCWLLFDVRSTPVLPQWHVKGPGHSAKSAGGTLHLNTHTPLT